MPGVGLYLAPVNSDKVKAGFVRAKPLDLIAAKNVELAESVE